MSSDIGRDLHSLEDDERKLRVVVALFIAVVSIIRRPAREVPIEKIMVG